MPVIQFDPCKIVYLSGEEVTAMDIAFYDVTNRTFVLSSLVQFNGAPTNFAYFE